MLSFLTKKITFVPVWFLLALGVVSVALAATWFFLSAVATTDINAANIDGFNVQSVTDNGVCTAVLSTTTTITVDWSSADPDNDCVVNASVLAEVAASDQGFGQWIVSTPHADILVDDLSCNQSLTPVSDAGPKDYSFQLRIDPSTLPGAALGPVVLDLNFELASALPLVCVNEIP